MRRPGSLRRQLLFWGLLAVVLTLLARPVAAQTPAPGPPLPGPPASIALRAVPDLIPADGGDAQVLYVQLRDAEGRATISGTDVVVSLKSSDTQIVRVPPTVTIAAGTGVLAAAITTTRKAGPSTIRASAPGLGDATAKITTTSTTMSLLGAHIQLRVAPSTLMEQRDGEAWLYAILVAEGGTPVLAPEAVTIALVSSNPAVLSVPPTLTIPAGAYAARAPVRQGVTGSAEVTGLRSGLRHGTVGATVKQSGDGPVTLKITVVPELLLLGGEFPALLVLQAFNAAGQPTPFPCAPVSLASTLPGVLNTPTTVQPPCGGAIDAAWIPLEIGGTASGSEIVAAIPGLSTALNKATVVGVAPARLQALFAPAVPVADGPSPGWIVVQLLDASGKPATAGRATVFTIKDEHGGVAQVAVPAGKSFAAVALSSSGAGRATTWQVSAEGLATVQVTAGDIVAPPGARRSTVPSLRIGPLAIPLPYLAVALVVIVIGLLARQRWPGGFAWLRRIAARR